MQAVPAFVGGVLLFQQLPVLPSGAWLLAGALLVPCWRLCRRWLLLPMLATGFLYAFSHALVTAPSTLPDSFLGETLWVEGEIAGLPDSRDRRTRFLFRADSLQLGDERLRGEWLFRVSWYREVPGLHAGERWRLPLRLKKVIGYRNPGSFDYAGWLYAQGVRYSGYVKGQGERIRPSRWNLDGLRQQISRRLEEIVDSPRAASVMRALAVGDRSGLERRDRDVFAATGTSHLMAISGLHIGLVSGLVYLLGRLLWRRFPVLCGRWPAGVAAALPAMLAGTGYAALAGFSLSTQRALVMLLVIMGALVWRRHLHPLQGLLVALLLVVILDPLSLRSAAFWLSFGAVGILYWVALQEPAKWAWLWSQFAISLGLMPILAWQQMELSLLSPLVNLFAIPLFSFLVVPGVLLGLLLEAATGWPGSLLLQGTAALVEKLLALLRWLARWNPVLSGREPLLWGVLAGLILVPGWRRWRGSRRWGLLLVYGAAVLGTGFVLLPDRPRANTFEFRLLDVGQGLAAVVRTSDHLLVFDTGPRFPSGFNTGSAVVAPYLRTLGAGRIDRLVLSHGDTDHVGGAAGLLQQVAVAEILGGEPDRLELRTQVTPCRRGEQWWWDGVHFRILSPGIRDGLEGNDASCVLRVSTGDQALLLTGDIGAGMEEKLVVRERERLKSTVVVAAHHGSSSSSTSTFIDTVAARYVLFSAGVHNRWGFPRAEVQRRWCEAGVLPLNTAVEGSIGFRFTPVGVQGPFLHAESDRRYWQWQMEQQIPVSCSMIAKFERKP